MMCTDLCGKVCFTCSTHDDYFELLDQCLGLKAFVRIMWINGFVWSWKRTICQTIVRKHVVYTRMCIYIQWLLWLRWFYSRTCAYPSLCWIFRSTSKFKINFDKLFMLSTLPWPRLTSNYPYLRHYWFNEPRVMDSWHCITQWRSEWLVSMRKYLRQHLCGKYVIKDKM